MTRFLLIRHPSGWLALDASRIQRIVARPRLLRLAGATPYLIGAFRLGEDVIPVVDLDLRWGIPPPTPTVQDQLVLAGSVALRAGEPRDLVEGHLEPLPPDWAVLPEARPVLQGLVVFPGGVAAALDLDRVLAIPEPLNLCASPTPEGWSDDDLRVLEERTSAYAQEKSHGQATPSRALALYILGGERYASDVREIREFLPVGQLVAVPGAPPAVKGLTQIRGRLVPVLDLAVLLGKPAAAREQAIRLVHPEALLAVDRIEEIREVQESSVRPMTTGPGRGLSRVELSDGPAVLLGLAELTQRRREGRQVQGGPA